MRKTRDQAGKEDVACQVRDVNADKLNDLVCEIDADALPLLKQQQRRQLEAMTHFGWGIVGTEAPRAAPVQAK